MSNENVVRMFWYGKQLSIYEQLSITSFLKHGHRVEVFAYNELNLPAGAVRVDAASLIPENEVFFYQHGFGKGSVAVFSDIFRYKLLYELGGIWADTDVLCLRPFDTLPLNCVGRQDAGMLNVALMRFQAKHPLLGELYEQALARGHEVEWGQIGPVLFSEKQPYYPDVTVLPSSVFYPVHWSEAWRLISPEEREYCGQQASDSYAVHWWNEIFRCMGIPKDKLPPASSFLGGYGFALLQEDDSWSEALLKTWVNNFRAAELAEPLQRYSAGHIELADFLHTLGSEQLSHGHWQQAAELLTAALQARPNNGRHIRQLLIQALTELEKQESTGN